MTIVIGREGHDDRSSYAFPAVLQAAQLRDLQIICNRIAEGALALLAGLSQLSSLSITVDTLPDSELEHLPDFTNLEELSRYGVHRRRLGYGQAGEPGGMDPGPPGPAGTPVPGRDARRLLGIDLGRRPEDT